MSEWSNSPMYMAHSGFSVNIDWIKDKINDWANDCRRVCLIQTCCEEECKKEGWWHTSTWNLSISLHVCFHTLSLDSAFIELALQWELPFAYFYPQLRTLKPTFPLRLNKVLVLHHSEKAADCAIPWTGTRTLLLSSLKKSYCLSGPPAPLTPATKVSEMPWIWLTSF